MRISPFVRSIAIRRGLAGALATFALAACGGGSSTPSASDVAARSARGFGTRAVGSAPTLTLWVTDNGGSANVGALYAFTISTASTTATLVPNSEYSELRPGINGNPAGIFDPEKIVFDKTGHLWVANAKSDLLVSFTINAPGTPPTLDLASGIESPFVIGTSPFGRYSGPNMVSYDAATDSLWTLADFYPPQAFTISQAGTLAAIPTKVTAHDDLTTRFDEMSFDRNGVLWGSNRVIPGVTAFAVSGGSATEVPGSQIAAKSGAPVFDASNNLWIADYVDVTMSAPPPMIREYTNPGASGTAPTPIASFTVAAPPAGSTRAVTPIGFDARGNLWLETTDLVSGSASRTFGLLAYDVSTTPPTLRTTIPLPPPNVQYFGLALAP